MNRVYLWDDVQELVDAGSGFVDCQRRFGFSHTAWIKAIRRGELRVRETPFPDRRRKYDWAEIQRYYDEGHSLRACQRKFGFNTMSWFKARQRGEIRSRPLGRPLTEVIANGKSRYNLKWRLIRAGILENRCSACGLDTWRGKPLGIQIDHINGKRNDNRIENLRMLCPNCHSQTDTFAGKKRDRSRVV